MNALYKTHLSAILAMLFWGLSYIWSKQVFEYLGPGTTVFIRLIISSVFLAVVLLATGRFEKIKVSHFKMFLLAALFNPFLYFVGESYGLNLVSPTISAVIIATIPVFTPIVAGIFTKERLSWFNMVGLAVSFIGVLIMLIEKDFSLAASPAGVLLLFGAVASAIVYGLILKKSTLLYSSLTIVWGQNTIGILYFLPLMLIETRGADLVQQASHAWVPLLLLGVFASSLAFVFFTYTVGKIGISRTNIYTNLIPVFAAFFSFIALDEKLLPSKIAGIVLVAVGVLLSQTPQKKLFLKKIPTNDAG